MLIQVKKLQKIQKVDTNDLIFAFFSSIDVKQL